MASKKETEVKKDANIHKTVKIKSPSGKDKKVKESKATEFGKNDSEKRSVSKTKTKHENSPSKREKSNSKTDKKTSKKTLILESEEVEGMTVPPSDQSGGPQQGTEPEALPDRKPRVHSAQVQGRPKVSTKQPPPTKDPTPPAKTAAQKQDTTAKSPNRKKKQSSDEEDDDEEPAVKQFSLPAYKILSGASVAPVQIHPQKVVIQRTEEVGKRHWAHSLTGLFQNSKLTLKLRMLRLLLIWIFFRVLNKQTAWLSDMLGIGAPDEDPAAGPRPKAPPGERFIKMFCEGNPNPYHVRVKRPL